MENQSQPSIFILTDYVKSIYSELTDYTSYFVDRAKLNINKEQFLNEVIDSVFNHKTESLMKLYEAGKLRGYTELHFFFLRLIKNKIEHRSSQSISSLNVKLSTKQSLTI